MEPSELERLKEVFYAAIEQPPELRPQFLAEACDGNETLRSEVARLLAEHDRAGGFLESPFRDILSIRQLANSAQLFETNHMVAGRYRVVSLLGEGGMGVVYKAEDRRLPRFVALKSAGRGLVGDEASLARLRREAQAASTLNHPNICTIHDVVESDGEMFIVMEYLDGQTLKEMIGGGHLSPPEATPSRNPAPLPLDSLIRIALQVIEGLESAHDKGIVHRDIKPANIFITKTGHIKILDFGIAKMTGVFEPVATSAEMAQSRLRFEGHLTAAGVATGTTGYMSPEQVCAKELDARTDLFSFGAVLYEMATGEMPFRGESTKLVLDSILRQVVVPVVKLNSSLPPELDRIIGKCLRKDRDRRYQNATEVRTDLQRLKLELEKVNSASRQFLGYSAKSWLLWAAAGCAIAALVLSFIVWKSGPSAVSPVNSPNPKAIAVLPFQNIHPDKSSDFLTLALPDEIATMLTYVPSFSVRPFAATRKYTAPDLDLQKAGREMGVASVVTGHYRAEGDQFEVTVEAVDVANNRSIWRDSVSVAAADKIALREEITTRVLHGLVPMLGGLPSAVQGTRPRNEQAYDLYLRSIAIPQDGPLNDEGISMLEQAVGIDPSYAPAWEALGRRYYVSGEYVEHGDPARQRSESALKRALALDPDLVFASAQLIVEQTERGNLRPAYEQATALVQRHPNNASGHFILSYVLRYAGLLRESARQCDFAFALDQSNSQLRGCSGTFMQLGESDRAKDFIRLDAGSQYATIQMAAILLGHGKVTDALQTIQRTSNFPWMGRVLIEACLVSNRSNECDQAAQKVETTALSQADVEVRYGNGTLLSYCGQKEAAVRVIKNAIEHNYCAYTTLQTDPMLVKLRGTPEYRELLASAKLCQERFLAGRTGVSP
jgi:eukaryotic-like serine/threonine-protein kinase